MTTARGTVIFTAREPEPDPPIPTGVRVLAAVGLVALVAGLWLHDVVLLLVGIVLLVAARWLASCTP